MKNTAEEINQDIFREFFLLIELTNASSITIEFDLNQQTLTITDDGDGFPYMEFLTIFANRGLNPLEINPIHPCYMFLKASYIVERMIVESGMEKILIEVHGEKDKLAYFAQKESWQSGYKVTFFGNTDNSFIPEKVLPFLSIGFPIPVTFNGKELARPYAINGSLKFSKTEIGYIHVAKSKGRPIEDLAIFMFLNGLARRVFEDRERIDDMKHIVHVDPEHHTLQALDPEELVNIVRRTITKLSKQLSIC
ncbi:MAG: hypothetical protein HQL69_06160 [Magnetococcales bacterium]|nr:hypothetical protein [Magnetococcales bacterium]